MQPDPGRDLVPVSVDRVLFFRDSAGVVLEAPQKRILIFVGLMEAQAIQRELAGEKVERPLTHDVVTYLMTGFDIVCRRVVISSLVNNVFCASLVLEQSPDHDQMPRPVTLDVRASDSIVIALKTSTQLEVTRRVLDAVEDVTPMLEEMERRFGEDAEEEGESEE